MDTDLNLFFSNNSYLLWIKGVSVEITQEELNQLHSLLTSHIHESQSHVNKIEPRAFTIKVNPSDLIETNRGTYQLIWEAPKVMQLAGFNATKAYYGPDPGILMIIDNATVSFEFDAKYPDVSKIMVVW